MATPSDIMEPSLTYMRIYYLASSLDDLQHGLRHPARSGRFQAPLYFLIAACLVNIALDLILVAGLDLGVAGAAIATIMSQLISAILTVIA